MSVQRPVHEPSRQLLLEEQHCVLTGERISKMWSMLNGDKGMGFKGTGGDFKG